MVLLPIIFAPPGVDIACIIAARSGKKNTSLRKRPKKPCTRYVRWVAARFTSEAESPCSGRTAWRRLLKIAHDLGVAVEYVETNSSWFKDSRSAVAFLTDLRARGLDTLLVSISPFHNEHIPFSKVKGVVEAAHRAGVGIFPWVTDFVSDLSQLDPHKTHSLTEFSELFGRDYLLQVLERYWVHMGGRSSIFSLTWSKNLFRSISHDQF